jgi:hypothetical protein
VPRAFSFLRRLSLFRLCACSFTGPVLLARCSSGSLGWDRRPVRAGSTETICSSAWQGAAASQKRATRPLSCCEIRLFVSQSPKRRKKKQLSKSVPFAMSVAHEAQECSFAPLVRGKWVASCCKARTGRRALSRHFRACVRGKDCSGIAFVVQGRQRGSGAACVRHVLRSSVQHNRRTASKTGLGLVHVV